MPGAKINDRTLTRLIDVEGVSQAEAARRLGVSRQAVSRRLQELRGRTTRVVAAKKIRQVVEDKINVLEQLRRVNGHANKMLDTLIRWQNGDPEALRVLESQIKRVTFGEGGESQEVVEVRMKDPRELALRCMAEIREQLELQMRIFETLYSLKSAEEFQNEVIDAIGEVEPSVRQRIIDNLNKARTLRSAISWS
jgi:predicted transcriptional regulator